MALYYLWKKNTEEEEEEEEEEEGESNAEHFKTLNIHLVDNMVSVWQATVSLCLGRL
jgi:hypothetical protein